MKRRGGPQNRLDAPPRFFFFRNTKSIFSLLHDEPNGDGGAEPAVLARGLDHLPAHAHDGRRLGLKLALLWLE